MKEHTFSTAETRLAALTFDAKNDEIYDEAIPLLLVEIGGTKIRTIQHHSPE
jgi:hypothetical protein